LRILFDLLGLKCPETEEKLWSPPPEDEAGLLCCGEESRPGDEEPDRRLFGLSGVGKCTEPLLPERPVLGRIFNGSTVGDIERRGGGLELVAAATASS